MSDFVERASACNGGFSLRRVPGLKPRAQWAPKAKACSTGESL